MDEQELHHGAPRVAHLGRAGDDVHPLLDRRGAARDELGAALDLAEADAADADDRQAGVIAEAGDEDSGLLPGLDQVRPLLDDDLPAVDLDLD